MSGTRDRSLDGGPIWIIRKKRKIQKAEEDIEQVKEQPKRAVRKVVKAVAREIAPEVPEPLKIEFQELFLDYSYVPGRVHQDLAARVDFLGRIRTAIEQQIADEEAAIQFALAEQDDEEDIEFLLMAAL